MLKILGAAAKMGLRMVINSRLQLKTATMAHIMITMVALQDRVTIMMASLTYRQWMWTLTPTSETTRIRVYSLPNYNWKAVAIPIWRNIASPVSEAQIVVWIMHHRISMELVDRARR
jgi:hypothetical protein